MILTHYDSISHALMEKLTQFGYPFVLVIDKLKEAQKYHDMGIPVMFGSIEDPKPFRQLESKMPPWWWPLMMISVMSMWPSGPGMWTQNCQLWEPATTQVQEDIIELAGANHVIRIAKQMGSFLARRISCTDNNTHVIGSFGEVLIAEATVHGTPLVGKQLQETHCGRNMESMWSEFGKEGILRPRARHHAQQPHRALTRWHPEQF